MTTITTLDPKAHLARTRAPLLESLPPIDWEDFETAAEITQKAIRAFVADKKLFRTLVEAAPEDPYLWSKCEQDVVEDKIVLWDDIDKGLRIRLRMSTGHQERLAHSHRFSFTNMVLRGKYVHWGYTSGPEFDGKTKLDDVKTVYQQDDIAGDVFTIHHEALHSTPFPELGTVSLVFRGNPVKERAPVMFKEARARAEAITDLVGMDSTEVEPAVAAAGTFFWRVGEERENAARRAQRQMTLARHAEWVTRLTEWGII